MRSKSKERLELDELLESVESKRHKLKPLPEYTYEYDAEETPASKNEVSSSKQFQELNGLITDFSRLMERAHFKEFIEAQEHPWRWHFINFFTSILKGMGFIFGCTLAIGSVLFIWSQLNWTGLHTVLNLLKRLY